MTNRKRTRRSRPVPLDECQSAVAVFAAAMGFKPLYLPEGSVKHARKVRTARLKITKSP